MKTAKKMKKSQSESVKKRSKDEYHHGDLRAALIDTTVKLLKTTPVSQLSMREIARAVKVSSAARFRHFKNKDELLAAISQQGFEMKKQFMLEAIAKAKNDPEAMLLGCGLAYLQMGLKYPQHFRLMMNSEIMPCQEYPDLAKAAVETFVVVRDVVEHCQAAGLMGSGNSYVRAMQCWSLVNGFTALYADQRLEWLGVTQEIAEAHLVSMMQQYLNGARQDLDEAPIKNAPLFQTKDSKEYFEIMEQVRSIGKLNKS